MHTVEHTDRFVVSLPNGQSLTIAKDGLKPDRMAELRAQSLPGMDEGGDTTDAAIKKIESEIADLESEAGDGGFAGYAARVNAADPEAVRAARYGTGDDRDAGTLSEGLGGLGVTPVAAPGLPMGAPIDTTAVDPGVVRQLLTHQPSEEQVALAEMGSNEGRVSTLGGVPENVAPFASPVTQTPVGSMVAGATPSLTAAQESMLNQRLPQIAAAPSIAESAAAGPEALDPEIVAKMKASLAEVGRAPQVEGIGASRMRPFVRPQGMVDALAGAEKAATDLGVLDAEHQRQRAEMMLAHEAQSADLAQRLDAEREAEYRRQQDLFSDVYSGKIDPNRLWGRMDTGSRGLALLGLALGAIGAGNTGVNATVGVLDKMIDRDVDAQAKDLDRRRTLYSEYLRMGYQREQARQMTKAALMETQAAQMQRLAAQNGSPRAIASAAATTAEMKMKAEAWFQQAQDTHAGREMQMIGLEQQRQIANMQAQQAARRAEAQLQVATAKQLSDQAKLQVTVAPGQVVTAANETARADLAGTVQAAQTIRQIIGDVKGRLHGAEGRAWLPGTAEAEQANVDQKSLIGLLNKMYGFGALDVRTLDLLTNMVPNIGKWLALDSGMDGAFDQIMKTVNARLAASLTANTRGGVFYGFESKPVGKAD